MALGVLQYQQDYDELNPPVVINGPHSGFGWANVIQPYIRSRQLFSCPSERNPRNDNVMQKGYTDYWFNQNLSRKTLEVLISPAQSLLLGDGDGGSVYSNARYAINALPKGWLTTPESPARRHIDGANYAFADGHVKWVRPQEITTSPTQSQAGRYTFSVR